MRVVLQRVRWASVHVDKRVVGEIGKGFLVLLGIHKEDTQGDADWLAQKIVALRCFSDAQGKMQENIQQVHGAILVVSQFTLYGNCTKGNRPDFLAAAPPEIAIPLYESFLTTLRSHVPEVASGEFGAFMDVSLCNEGPVTLLFDSQRR